MAWEGIRFQYNPEELRRRIDLSPEIRNRETISCALVFDATDDRTDFHLGDVFSSLAALEVLAASGRIREPTSFLERLFGVPATAEPPISLFVYGEARVLPVRISRLDVSETLHDPALRVVRATVRLTMIVLTERDVPSDHPAAAVLSSMSGEKRSRAVATFEEFPDDLG